MPSATGRADDLFDFEFVNDTNAGVMVYALHGGGRRAGTGIELPARQNDVLCLQSGVLYRYAVERRAGLHVRVVNISVNIWRNARCRISDIFTVDPQRCGCDQYVQLTEGVKVVRMESTEGRAMSHSSMHDPCHDTGWVTSPGRG